jgi:transposase, IS6 family
VKSSTRFRPWLPPKSAFAGFRFPAEVIVVAVCWYLRFNLSYRDVPGTAGRTWRRSRPRQACTGGCNASPHCWGDAARFARHGPGDRWFVDETYVKVNGVWRYVYRAIDQHGQVLDVLVSARP